MIYTAHHHKSGIIVDYFDQDLIDIIKELSRWTSGFSIYEGETLVYSQSI